MLTLLVMEYVLDEVKVEGDFLIDTNNGSTNASRFTAGTMTICGDFTQKYSASSVYGSYGFNASDKHIVILPGKQMQEIKFEKYPSSHFNNLKLVGDINKNYKFTPENCWNSLSVYETQEDLEKSLEAEKPNATENPSATENPATSDLPEMTKEPQGTGNPTETENPGTTNTPQPTTTAQSFSTEQPSIPTVGTIIMDDNEQVSASYKLLSTDQVSYEAASDKNITKAVIPATITKDGNTYKVTSISNNAFSGCNKLQSVTIGKNVTNIGNNAFSKCKKLKKIVIPANVKKIGKRAFYGCKNLKIISIKTKKLKSKSVGAQAFKGIHKKAVIKVPKKQKKTYKNG